MTFKPSLQLLANNSLFGGLSEACCRSLVDRLERHEFARDDVIYNEGDIARELYIVESGRLEVLKPSVVTEVVLFEIGCNDFFGDLSFIDMQPRSMTVRAAVDSVLWRLDYGALRDIYQADIRCYTLLIMNIAREISRRLRRSDHNWLPPDDNRR